MSAIDHAFIRAYTTDVMPGGIAASAAEPQRETTIGQGAASHRNAAPPVAGAALAVDPPSALGRPHFPRTAPRLNTDNAIVPAPHIKLASFAHSVTTLDVQPEAPIPVRIDPPAVAQAHRRRSRSPRPRRLAGRQKRTRSRNCPHRRPRSPMPKTAASRTSKSARNPRRFGRGTKSIVFPGRTFATRWSGRSECPPTNSARN